MRYRVSVQIRPSRPCRCFECVLQCGHGAREFIGSFLRQLRAVDSPDDFFDAGKTTEAPDLDFHDSI